MNDDAIKFVLVSTNYLHSLRLPRMPPHELHLKVGVIVILLRNSNSRDGLCNGTPLLVLKMTDNVIQARMLTGNNVGLVEFISQIINDLKESDSIFCMRRIQFPLRLAFSITINKAQGQTIERVDVYLPSPGFGHDQLYVALSHARSFNDVRIKIESSEQ